PESVVPDPRARPLPSRARRARPGGCDRRVLRGGRGRSRPHGAAAARPRARRQDDHPGERPDPEGVRFRALMCGRAAGTSSPRAIIKLMKFTRITVRPDVCTGKPCIRDLRFPVSRLLGLLAARQTPEEILRAYPYLEAADIDEALRYAASLAEDET